MVIVYVPEFEGVVVMLSMEAEITHWLHGGTVTVALVRVAAGPHGETVAVRDTDAENRLVELMLILEVTDLPGMVVRALGLAPTEKPGGVFDFRHAASAWIAHPEKP